MNDPHSGLDSPPPHGALQPAARARIGRAEVILVFVTLLWGMSFPWTKHWQEEATGCPSGPLQAALTLIALRMILALVIMALWQPGLYRRPSWREHGAGAFLGATFFGGFLPQTVGLAYTTPALSSFFTGLASGWAPLLGWALFRTQVARLTILGLGIALGGMMVLVEGGWRLGYGEKLTFAASLSFGAQILVLDRLGRRFAPAHLTPGFFAGTALLGFAGVFMVSSLGSGLVDWLDWTVSMLRRPPVLRDLLLLALLPTVLSFHWMNTYQPLMPASRAALIYLLEPIFSSFFSVCLGYDSLKAPLLIGGALILLGNLLVELPALRARR